MNMASTIPYLDPAGVAGALPQIVDLAVGVCRLSGLVGIYSFKCHSPVDFRLLSLLFRGKAGNFSY
jgi:hypothetical protein